MDKQKLSQMLIEAALAHVPFDGWSDAALTRAAADVGLRPEEVVRLFPGGASEALDHYIALNDEKMIETLSKQDLSSLKVRERITLAVRTRFEVSAAHKEAVRRGFYFHMLPQHMRQGICCLYRTVDSIWHAIGDTSTDFNFYTKRATLAAVFSSTLLTWLNDESENHQDTWAFLDRRIQNVMQFEKAKHAIKKQMESFSFSRKAS